MISLEELQKKAKSGDISKKLLASEEFKNEFKKVLKEENGMEVNDEQVSEIIKKFEGALQNKELLNNLELETVSGGADHKKESGTFEGLGALLGMFTGYFAGGTIAGRTDAYVRSKVGRQRIDQAYTNENPSAADIGIVVGDQVLTPVNSFVSRTGGLVIGYKAEKFIGSWIDKLFEEKKLGEHKKTAVSLPPRNCSYTAPKLI